MDEQVACGEPGNSDGGDWLGLVSWGPTRNRAYQPLQIRVAILVTRCQYCTTHKNLWSEHGFGIAVHAQDTSSRIEKEGPTVKSRDSIDKTSHLYGRKSQCQFCSLLRMRHEETECFDLLRGEWRRPNETFDL